MTPDPRAPRPQQRRRVSRRRYQLRRAGALGVVVVVGLAIVGGARAVIGSDGGDIASATSASLPDQDLVGATGTTLTAPGGTTTPPTTPPTTQPESAGPPTAANPAVMLIAGDSDAGAFGPYLTSLMDDTGVVRTELDYKVSSGLARPDFFDWPAHLSQVLPAVDPDVVVMTLGGNDSQGLAIADGTFIAQSPTGDAADDAEWRAEYGRRVGAAMDQVLADGRTLIWVGIPNDDNDDVTTRLRVQDEVAKAEAAKRPEVVFVDTWNIFSGKEGGWAEYHVDPRDGQGKKVRASDGFHLNTVGAEILALEISAAVQQALRDRGAAI